MAADAQDVGITIGVFDPTPEQILQWQMWLDDAALQISLWATRHGYAALDPAAVAYVTREAVAAKAKRPDSATQVDVQVDDAQVSRRYAVASGQVTILPEWWDLLTPVATNDSGAFSIRLGWS